jgi:nitrate/nitrite transport system permease protein
MLNQTVNILNKTGLTWFVPFVRLLAGQDPWLQVKDILRQIGIPVVAFCLFLVVWHVLAQGVQTSLGTLPGPLNVYAEAKGLIEEHHAEREKEERFNVRQQERVAQALADDPKADVTLRKWTGKPTFLDQIVTSLYTVFTGFWLATFVAVPVGILCGLSPTMQLALNPLIQVYRPVSPLAWLPIVTLIVSAVYTTSDGAWFEKSFITSAITVTLCSLWPTLINTSLGVSSIDKDLINVSKVLRLPWYTKVMKIVLPSSLELIFTGLRLSLGVGWMVLIAAEMLAQNPGLGKFVWDEFQNGSSNSLGRIMVAVYTIGFVGFVLDRIMYTAQQLVSFGGQSR